MTNSQLFVDFKSLIHQSALPLKSLFPAPDTGDSGSPVFSNSKSLICDGRPFTPDSKPLISQASILNPNLPDYEFSKPPIFHIAPETPPNESECPPYQTPEISRVCTDPNCSESVCTDAFCCQNVCSELHCSYPNRSIPSYPHNASHTQREWCAGADNAVPNLALSSFSKIGECLCVVSPQNLHRCRPILLHHANCFIVLWSTTWREWIPHTVCAMYAHAMNAIFT